MFRLEILNRYSAANQFIVDLGHSMIGKSVILLVNINDWLIQSFLDIYIQFSRPDTVNYYWYQL